MHDPKVYEDPEVFNPDRYLESDTGTKKGYKNDIVQRDNLTFGGGRVGGLRLSLVPNQLVADPSYAQRMCAGMHVAKYSLVSLP